MWVAQACGLLGPWALSSGPFGADGPFPVPLTEGTRSPNANHAAMQIEITVGPRKADLTGRDHLALQAAVEAVLALGGGTVRIRPGVYEMGNSLFLRSGVRIIGSGEDTVLRKTPSAATKLTEDLDWYGTIVPVKDASIFRVGGGLLLRGKSPHDGREQFVRRTVVAINGNDVHLDRDPRSNFWVAPSVAPPEGAPPFAGAQAATLYPVITGEHVSDVVIENLTIDGNRAENENLNGNYGGGIFIQDCERIRVADVTSRDNNGDGVSWQVCHDVTIEGCRLLNNSDLGLHPGSGSQRPVIRGNVSRGNDQGLFFCWGVKGGIAEGNTIEDSGKFGMSIGHRDTDNVIRDNVIRRSGQHGVIFREHVHPARDPHRNVLERNVIEDSGTKGECVAIEMLGTAEGVVLRDNVIRDTRRKSKTRQRIGLRIGPGIRNLTQENCIYENMEVDVVERRGPS